MGDTHGAEIPERDLPPPSCGGILSGEELRFPLGFDLRIIYLKEGGGTIREDLERIYLQRGVVCELLQVMDIAGSKYARSVSRLTFSSRAQMDGTYADIGKLAYVKSAI